MAASLLGGTGFDCENEASLVPEAGGKPATAPSGSNCKIGESRNKSLDSRF
jgi:hypothetical protein